jgi:acetate kinase
MTTDILALNAGSSSVKFALFELAAGDDLSLVSKGEIEGIGTAPHFRAVDTAGHILAERRWTEGGTLGHEAFLTQLFAWIEDHRGGRRLVAAGHRVVHGGTAFSTPVLVDDRVLTALDRLAPLAPLHQPHNLAAIRALKRIRPALPQIACFDTAFHHDLAPVVIRFALPREYEAAGVRRYGFHGLSYEYVSRTLAKVAPEAYGAWLGEDSAAPAELLALLEPYRPDAMRAYPVSTAVNTPKNDAPECIEPAA